MNIVLGLDGFHEDLLCLTPTIHSLWKEGTSGTMKSTIPTVTSTAHASLQLSLTPGDHGIVGFMDRENHIYDSKDIRNKTFYELIVENGISVFLMNLPYTHPPKITGDLVTSWMTKSNRKGDFVHPMTLFDRFPSLKEYEFYNVGSSDIVATRILKSKIPLINEVVKRKEHEFMLFYISETDWVQHSCYAEIGYEGKKTNRIFELADNLTKEIMENVTKNDNFVIMSDHGFCLKEGVFRINDWLREKGFLKFKKGGRRIKSVSEVKEKKLFNVNRWGLSLWNSPLGGLLKPLKGIVETQTGITVVSNPQIDMAKSMAYSRINEDMGIEMNPRFKRGKIKREIIKELESIPSIRPVAREDLYPNGKRLEKLPEIFVLSKRWKIKERFSGSIFERTPTPDHHLDGIFIGYGKDFEQNDIQCSILDFAPTVLTFCGVSVPPNMQGKAIPL